MRISDWSSDVCSSDLHIIGFQVTRWIQAHADTGGRAGRDDVARHQGNAARAGFDQGGNVEDEISCMTVLTGFAVNPAAYTCAGSVKLVSGNHPGSHWAEGVEGFAQVPLLVTHLHVSCRYVVHDGIAEHMLQGVVLAYVLSTGTDDDSQFCFVIDLAGHGTGQDHVVVRTHQALRNLGEYNRTDRRLAIVGFE